MTDNRYLHLDNRGTAIGSLVAIKGSDQTRMRTLAAAVVGFFLSVVAIPAIAEDRPAELGNNAALKYWQAFGALPRRDPAQEKILEKWRDMPLDKAARDLVAEAKQSLLYLRRGSRLDQCDWGLDFEDGGALLAQHLDRAMTLARLAGLRARLEFADDEQEDAVADLLAALALGRHCSSDGLIISLLVRASIESQVVDVLAEELPRLNGAVCDKLSTGLSALPSGGTFRDAVLKEKEIGHGWMVRNLNRMQADAADHWRDEFIRFFSGKDLHSDEAEELRLKLAAAGNPSLEQLVTWFRELGPFYDELAEILSLNEEQFEARLTQIMAKFGRKNPVASLWLPGQGLFKVYRLEKRDNARMRMLEAAVVIAKNGHKALTTFIDPYGDGPFEYVELPGGFELRSKLLIKGEHVTLKVGNHD